jgi:hypothetical protein
MKEENYQLISSQERPKGHHTEWKKSHSLKVTYDIIIFTQHRMMINDGKKGCDCQILGRVWIAVSFTTNG